MDREGSAIPGPPFEKSSFGQRAQGAPRAQASAHPHSPSLGLVVPGSEDDHSALLGPQSPPASPEGGPETRMTEDCQALVSQQSFRNPPSHQVSSRAEEMPLAWVQGPGWRTTQGRVRFWWESARRGLLAALGAFWLLGGAGQGGEGPPPSTAVFVAESQAPNSEHGRMVCGVTVKTTRADECTRLP